MTAETRRDIPERLQIDSEFFLEQLESVKGDPHETLITMQRALDIDLGRRMDLHPYMERDNPETVRDARLSLLQYEKIMSLGELVSIYIEHGTYTPRELGLWLKVHQVSIMGERKPIDVLLAGFSEKGFHLGSLTEVSEHARAFLKESGREAVWARWGN